MHRQNIDTPSSEQTANTIIFIRLRDLSTLYDDELLWMEGLVATDSSQSISIGLLKDGKTHLITKVSEKSTKYKIYDNV